MGNTAYKVLTCQSQDPDKIPRPTINGTDPDNPKTQINNVQIPQKNSNLQTPENEKSEKSNMSGELQSDQDQEQHAKSLSINDFVMVSKLGKGAFGQVFKVKRNDSNLLTNKTQNLDIDNTYYAMKIMKKQDIVKQKMVSNIVLERNVLLNNQHPYIVGLKYSFQSKNKIYLVMEYLAHGNLYGFLRQNGRFTENQAKFIFAEVVLGIQHCHEVLKIKYRDLKPENILVSHDGHVMLADFGLSKTFKDRNDMSSTQVGTPEYLAPEILLKKPHHKEVDLWALGVFLYELLCGQPPFTDEKRNLHSIFQQILKNDLQFPQNVSVEGQDMIRQLIRNNPLERLGSNDFNDLKYHIFFSGVNWDHLMKQQVKGPLLSLLPKSRKIFEYKPRQIYETPVDPLLELPYINGITYNKDITTNGYDKVHNNIKQFK